MVFFVLRCVFAVLAFWVLWKLLTAGMVCYRCQPPVSACLRWASGIPWHLSEAQKRLCHDSGDETERPSASGGSVMARLGSAVRGGFVMSALLQRRHPMQLGIISDLRNPQHPKFHRPWVHNYTEFLDLMVQLEDLGFEEVVVPEHHFEPDGYIPNPIPIFMPAQTPKAMERNAREGYGANQGAGWWTFERGGPGLVEALAHGVAGRPGAPRQNGTRRDDLRGAYAFHKLFAEEVWPKIKDLTLDGARVTPASVWLSGGSPGPDETRYGLAMLFRATPAGL